LGWDCVDGKAGLCERSLGLHGERGGWGGRSGSLCVRAPREEICCARPQVAPMAYKCVADRPDEPVALLPRDCPERAMLG
jgi:hypothetical protein